jgi:hypothetical protein
VRKSKKQEVFFFRGSALNASGSVAGLQCGLGFAKAIFWGFGFSRNQNLFFEL